jgi:transcriptional regulator with XRE-family HTH domain
MTIGERLRALRGKKLWSTRKAAEFFGVSQSEIWRLESEKNQPNLVTNAKWKKLLDEAEKEENV